MKKHYIPLTQEGCKYLGQIFNTSLIKPMHYNIRLISLITDYLSFGLQQSKLKTLAGHVTK